jgi:type III pantothenate kinase
MLLVVDVGNTNAVFGVYRSSSADLAKIWRLTSRRDRTADEWFALLQPLLVSRDGDRPRPEAMVVSSVVPAITTALERFAHDHLNVDPLIVRHDLDLGIRVCTAVPAETGTDRIVNAAAAFARFGGPTIVVDLGTATKIEAITGDGDYLGGVIAPGVGLALDTLAGRAARLYAVELKRPVSTVGRNTVGAVQSGVVEGHLAMIEGMVQRVRAELAGARHVVLTGGHSPLFADTTSVFTDVVPHLTLEGLRRIYLRNACERLSPRGV